MITEEQYKPLGIAVLDEQHRGLIRLMGRLHDTVVNRPVLGERPVEEAFRLSYRLRSATLSPKRR